MLCLYCSDSPETPSSSLPLSFCIYELELMFVAGQDHLEMVFMDVKVYMSY